MGGDLNETTREGNQGSTVGDATADEHGNEYEPSLPSLIEREITATTITRGNTMNLESTIDDTACFFFSSLGIAMAGFMLVSGLLA